MAENSLLTTSLDISKLKVPDLKKELKSRGLSTNGNKNELVERLQAVLKSTERASNESVDDLDEDLLNEDDDDVHLETTESVISDIDTALSDTFSQKGQKRKSEENGNKEPKDTGSKVKKVVLNRNTPIITDKRISTDSKEDSDKTNGTTEEKKVIKLSGITAKERLEMRAKKFNAPLTNEAKKVARAERFGNSVSSSSNNSDIAIKTKVDTSVDVLKQRAERFGGSVSKIMTNLDIKERMEKRKERFGIVTQDDKAKQRLERFKQTVK